MIRLMSATQPQEAGPSRVERSDIAVAAVVTALGALLMVANLGGPPTDDDEASSTTSERSCRAASRSRSSRW